MSFYGKVYTYVSEENFEQFVKSLGLPEDKAKTLLDTKTKQKIEKNGDEYKITLFIPAGEKVFTFKSGAEIADNFRDIPITLTFNIDGNKITQVVKFDSGITLTVKKEYTDDKLVEEHSHNKWNGVSRRIFKQL